MEIHDIEGLETLSDEQLWEVATNRHNPAKIRQKAIRRWLFPDETDINSDPDTMGGGRLRELQARSIILESDEINENDTKDAGEMAPYFDSQGRLILEHDGVSYLIETMDDDGAYDGISVRDDLYTTDDKTYTDRDI